MIEWTSVIKNNRWGTDGDFVVDEGVESALARLENGARDVSHHFSAAVEVANGRAGWEAVVELEQQVSRQYLTGTDPQLEATERVAAGCVVAPLRLDTGQHGLKERRHQHQTRDPATNNIHTQQSLPFAAHAFRTDLQLSS